MKAVIHLTLPFFRLGAGHGAPAGEPSGQLGKGQLDKAPSAAKIDEAAGVPHLTVDRGAARRGKLQPLCFPLPMPAKVAIIEARFESARNLRWFDQHDRSWMTWGPDALVLPLSLALLLADQKRCGQVQLPELSVAVVALSSMAEGPMDERQRGRLWRAFQVPVFEQLRDRDGVVIARECEVHRGLHVDPKAAEVEMHAGELLTRRERTGLAGDMVRGCCECGAETPRLLRLAPLRVAVGATAGR